jgi:uncharacterized protein (TIGR00369 family)
VNPKIEFPDNVLELLNANLGGFNQAVGLAFSKATPDEFAAELTIDDRHRQPYGLVHGGLLCAMIETVCSAAAALNVFGAGKTAVGLENSTSFLRAVRAGRLICRAQPLVRGRRSHVWEGQIHDDRDRLVASGRVRMVILEPDAQADGDPVHLEHEPG